MREHDLELLELPAVLTRLAGVAASDPGAALAEALRPSADADEVRLRQQQTAEAIALLDDAAEPDLGGAADVGEAADLAARGSTLDTRSLSQIERTIRAGVTARRAIAERDDLPALLELVQGIEPSLLSVAEEVGRSVEEDGSDLKDSASPALRRLRRELREGRGKLAERLRKIARDPALAEHLQDDFVTERGGRPVLALKASARGRVPGIVHDSSGSGQTLFVEPLAAVDDSNRLREAEVAERDEVARILRNLSSLVAAQAEELTTLVRATARARPRTRVRHPLARLAGSDRDAEPRCRPPRRPAPAAREGRCRPDRSRARLAAGARDQRPEHRRQDGRPEDARPRRRPLPVRPATAGGRGVAAGLRPDPRRHRRRAVDRDEPLDLLGARAQPGRDPRAGNRQLARPPRRARSRHRPGRGSGARRGAARDACRPGAADGDDEPLRGVEGVGERRRRRGERRHRRSTPRATSRSTRSSSAAPGRHMRCRPRRASACRSPSWRPRASESRPSGCSSPSSLQRPRRRHARRRQCSRPPTAEQAEAEAARLKAQRAAEGLQDEIEQVRSSAAAERQRALAEAETELGGVRAELEELRAEIRAARKLERERGRATNPAAQKKEAERDRRLGAASERAVRASRSLARLDEPLLLTAPLAAGDPVVAAELGVRGTITEGQRRAFLASALSTLNDREKRIFEARRLAEEPATLEDLSAEFGVSRERIRQIEVRAFEKVQSAVQKAARKSEEGVATVH